MKKVTKARLADGLLKTMAVMSVTTTSLCTPRAVTLLDAPLQRLLDKLDERERQRCVSEALSYLRYNKLITEDYQHGLRITKKAQRRLEALDMRSLSIPIPRQWDGVWRIVFFDIPETHKTGRDGFAMRLRSLGFGVLQRSVFIYPYPCRDEVARVARYYLVMPYITYIETLYIDNDVPLKEHFKL